MLLSVITVVSPDDAHLLPETAASVRSLRHLLTQSGGDVEWIVAVDGDLPLPKFATGETTFVLRLHRPAGPTAARNHATAAAGGRWLCILDPGAQALAPGIAGLLRKLAAAPDTHWAVSGHLDATTGAAHQTTSTNRAIAPGELAIPWSRGARLNEDGLLVTRNAITAAGGWVATADRDVTATLLVVSEHVPGALATDITTSVERDRRTPVKSDIDATVSWTTATLVNAHRERLGRESIVAP